VKQPETVVFFGKGGIGKSTLASNLSVLLAAGGGKVLHVGCDPKMDSTLALARGRVPPFNGAPGPDAGERLRGFIRPAAVEGVHCVEAGGPEAGLGCAGAGIGALLEAIKDSAILEKDGYTAAVFDVLGDVVCGGFAAPLRRGFARKVVIVTSEEPLSLYSANRLIAMVGNYSRNGVYLAGLAVNLRDPAGAAAAEAFAAAVNTRVLGIIPRDPAVQAAERLGVPAVLHAPGSGFAGALTRLAGAIAAAGPRTKPPRPLSDAEFGLFAAGRAVHRAPAPGPGRVRAGAVGVEEAFKAAGLTPSGMEGEQIVCDWDSPAGRVKVVLAAAGPATAGQLLFSDCAACLHPSSDPGIARKVDIMDAVRGLTGFRFDQLLGYFGLGSAFHGAVGALGASSGFSDRADKAGGEPRTPHLGSGHWYRFLFSSGSAELALPPDLVVVEHGDAECRFCDSFGGPLGLFGGRPDSVPDLAKARPNVFSTGLGRREALLGDEGLVKEALEAAAASAGPGGLVEFYSTCAPLLLAGDTDPAVRAAAGRTGAAISRQNYNSYEEYSESRAAARSALVLRGLERGRKAGAKPRFDVALHGYDERLAGTLRGVLAKTGTSAAPETEDFYGPLLEARLQVLRCRDEALCPALDRAGITWVVPPAPYGFEGSKAWLKAILKALGRRLPAAALPSREQAARLRSLRALARKYRIGLSAPAEEIGSITGERLAEGLGIAAEAGFGFELLVYLEGEDGRKAALGDAARLGRALKTRGLRTRFFSTPAELQRLLSRRGGPDLVYSDLRRDPRVLAAGRNPFSSLLFEPGYEGALESARRLLELCEWKFSARYLARPSSL